MRMLSAGSITYWLEQLKTGDQAAVQRIWERYFQRLVELARKRLQSAPRRAADEEDVALNAFDSFYRRAREGRFPQLLDREDLWQVLVLITSRKVRNLIRNERAQKRGGGEVQNESALPGGDSAPEGTAFASLISQEPDPGFAVQVAEDYQRLLATLGRDELRSIAVWKLEGFTNEEIAAKLSCAKATIERKLRLIRSTWEKEIGP
jgi:DNA-directed RNA polymerase specialized sigma24 family protein